MHFFFDSVLNFIIFILQFLKNAFCIFIFFIIFLNICYINLNSTDSN